MGEKKVEGREGERRGGEEMGRDGRGEGRRKGYEEESKVVVEELVERYSCRLRSRLANGWEE